MKGFLSEFIGMVKEELANSASEDQLNGDGEEEFPHLHRPLGIPGFTKLSPEATAEIAKQGPIIDPDLPYDLKYSEDLLYKGKQLKRDPKLGAYTDLYRKMSAAEPAMAATYEYRGILVADASKTAEQENERLVECIAPFLPAYILKQNYDGDTFGFQVSTPEALYALLNNAVYNTFDDFGYRDPEPTIEIAFTNLLLSYSSRINILFPELGGLIHLGNCGQLYIGAVDDERLAELEGILEPVGEFVEASEDEG